MSKHQMYLIVAAGLVALGCQPDVIINNFPEAGPAPGADAAPSPDSFQPPCPDYSNGGVEQCSDGKDNDCNGKVDDGCPPDGGAVDTGADASPTSCKAGDLKLCSVCGDGTGYYECVGGVFSSTCKEFRGLCTDGGAGGSGGSGGTGGSGGSGGGGSSSPEKCTSTDSPRECNKVGTCQGWQFCESGKWGVCREVIGPTAEICDGLDNDCDLSVDESCVPPADAGPMPTPSPSPTPTPGPEKCTSSTAPRRCHTIGTCFGWQFCENGTWGACREVVLPAAEVCDGLDNDCDISIDESCSPPDSGMADAGSADATPDAFTSCNPITTLPKTIPMVGECRGYQYCQTSGFWSETVFNVSASTEYCDGKDNDCDGTTDESCTPPPADAGVVADMMSSSPDAFTACDPKSDPPREIPTVGECRGHQYCQPDGSWSTAIYSVDKSTEYCDGKDNDCDGTTDESCTPLPEPRPEPGPEPGPDAGSTSSPSPDASTTSSDEPRPAVTVSGEVSGSTRIIAIRYIAGTGGILEAARKGGVKGAQLTSDQVREICISGPGCGWGRCSCKNWDASVGNTTTHAFAETPVGDVGLFLVSKSSSTDPIPEDRYWIQSSRSVQAGSVGLSSGGGFVAR